MKKVFWFSALLVAGLVASQFLPELPPSVLAPTQTVIAFATMALLGFIMIHVGFEFEIDKRNLKPYAIDYAVAATAAGFPWVFCSAYFVFVLRPEGDPASFEAWRDALLTGRFAAPTSAGILFSMLAAAGLSSTWLFKKARVLAIFDDLDTVLLMIPLKMMIVGARWQLAVIVLLMAAMLAIAWRYLHSIRWPTTWKWVLGYSIAITAISEAIYVASKAIDDVVPIHIEVLLPAFVLGCILVPRHATGEPHDEREEAGEAKVSTLISGLFMVFVGLSMPKIVVDEHMGWGGLALHTAIVTVIANLGKMFPIFCYRGESTFRERLALCIGLWPRGEVGAGVLVLSLGYGLGGAMVAVATLSLALNLLLTGVFIVLVQRLLASNPKFERAS